MHLQQLSPLYTVRALLPEEAPVIYEILRHNTLFYQYHPPMVTVESIRKDMEALPPNKSRAEKHYIGFFQKNRLIAVMDLIEHYPQRGTAMIGFFAIDLSLQGNGTGSAIIQDSTAGLARMGFQKIRLAIDKGNPQSRAFWTKNGFALTGEQIKNDFSSYLVMEKQIAEEQILKEKVMEEQILEEQILKGKVMEEQITEKQVMEEGQMIQAPTAEAKKILLDNIDKLHTTALGIDRIRRNLKLENDDVIAYCKNIIRNPNCHIYKQGKNWYCEADHIKITVNSYSYTIITAHII